jgi:channel protein (hemolysin III family)
MFDALAAAGINDPVSSLTHLVGAIAFAWLGVSLVREAEGDGVRRVAVVVFAFSCALMLLVSGLYHMSAQGGVARYVMQRVDHAAVFILIAATFTPLHAILLRGRGRWGVLAGVWALALAGLALKSMYFNSMPEWVSLALYLAFGWLGIASVVTIGQRLGAAFVRPLLFGAVAYTAGAFADFAHWPAPISPMIGSHELFHVAVLAGIGFHWNFVREFASGKVAALLIAPATPRVARVGKSGREWPGAIRSG